MQLLVPVLLQRAMCDLPACPATRHLQSIATALAFGMISRTQRSLRCRLSRRRVLGVRSHCPRLGRIPRGMRPHGPANSARTIHKTAMLRNVMDGTVGTMPPRASQTHQPPLRVPLALRPTQDAVAATECLLDVVSTRRLWCPCGLALRAHEPFRVCPGWLGELSPASCCQRVLRRLTWGRMCLLPLRAAHLPIAWRAHRSVARGIVPMQFEAEMSPTS